MASIWKKTIHYLGLAPDEEYDDYEGGALSDDHDYDHEGAGPVRSVATSTPRRVEAQSRPTVQGESIGDITPTPMPPTPRPARSATNKPRTAAVRPIPPVASGKPHVIAPRSFNDAQEVADKFKGNQPVIVNLQDVERDLSRRIIDFASGLCYGLTGQMEKVANQVYLLTPSDVEVSPEERRRLRDAGLHDE